jgi:hypothetical protein
VPLEERDAIALLHVNIVIGFCVPWFVFEPEATEKFFSVLSGFLLSKFMNSSG